MICQRSIPPACPLRLFLRLLVVIGVSLGIMVRPWISTAAVDDAGAVTLAPIEIHPLKEDKWLPIDYPSAISIAAAKNLDILQARARLEEAEGEQARATGRLIPSFSASLYVGGIDGRIQGSFGLLMERDFNTVNPAAVISLRLNPGQAIYDLLATYKQVEAREFAAEDVTQETLARVAGQYLGLQRAQAGVNIAAFAVATSTELLRLARDREELGVGLKVDVARAEALQAQDQVDLATAEQRFRVGSADLAETLRLEPEVLLFPTEKELRRFTLVGADLSLDELRRDGLLQRPELRELARRTEALRDTRSAAQWKALGPETYGFFEESAIGRSFDVGERHQYGGFIGWTLTATSFGDIQIAAAQVRQAELAQDQVEIRVEAEVVKARARMAAAAERLAAAQRGVAAAEQSFTLTEDRLQGGVGLQIEVIQAQEALIAARTSLVGALVEYNAAQVNFLLALGRATQDQLLAAVE